MSQAWAAIRPFAGLDPELANDMRVRAPVRLVGADLRDAEDPLDVLAQLRLREDLLRLLRTAVRQRDDARLRSLQPLEGGGRIVLRLHVAEPGEDLFRAGDLQFELRERRLQRRSRDLAERTELADCRQRQRAVQGALEPCFERGRGRTEPGQLRPHGVEAEQRPKHVEDHHALHLRLRFAYRRRARIDAYPRLP
jgi:hypothetical protein